MLVNEEKKQIVHFRPTRYKRSDFKCKFGNVELKTLLGYIYTEIWILISRLMFYRLQQVKL